MDNSRLYYDEPETISVTSTVAEISRDGDAGLIVLDRTPFYPEGGGQPCDLGRINGLPLDLVSEIGGRVSHRVIADDEALARAGIAPGASVEAYVDAARRRDHTEQHTAQHLLSATALRLTGGPTRSFHLGERYCVIDLDLPALGAGDAEAIGDEVMKNIRKGYGIRTHLCPPEDPASFPLRRRPPEGADRLRIVEIDGIDFTPCCGTHLSTTAEIGLFRIIKTEKYKGMTRIYFVAGGRAFAEYGRLAASVRGVAAAFACAEDDVASAASAAAERARALESELESALEALASARAGAMAAAAGDRALVSATLGDAGVAGVAGVASDAGFAVYAGIADGFATGIADASRLAKAIAGLGRIGLVASIGELKAAAASPAGGIRLGESLKPLLAACGGKGGGGPTFFQAAFGDAAALEAFMQAAGKSLA